MKTKKAPKLSPRIVERLLSDWLDGRAESSRSSDGRDLNRLAVWADAARPTFAVQKVLAAGESGAARLAGELGNWLAERYTASSAARTMATLRSVIRAGKKAGLITWTLSAPRKPESMEAMKTTQATTREAKSRRRWMGVECKACGGVTLLRLPILHVGKKPRWLRGLCEDCGAAIKTRLPKAAS